MASAFNWSPGNCCCTPHGKYFDIWCPFSKRESGLSQLAPPIVLVRSAPFAPRPVPPRPYTSREGAQWFITPSVEVEAIDLIIDEDSLWTLQRRTLDDQVQELVGYTNGEERFRIPLNQTGLVPNSLAEYVFPQRYYLPLPSGGWSGASGGQRLSIGDTLAILQPGYDPQPPNRKERCYWHYVETHYPVHGGGELIVTTEPNDDVHAYGTTPCVCCGLGPGIIGREAWWLPFISSSLRVVEIDKDGTITEWDTKPTGHTVARPIGIGSDRNGSGFYVYPSESATTPVECDLAIFEYETTILTCVSPHWKTGKYAAGIHFNQTSWSLPAVANGYNNLGTLNQYMEFLVGDVDNAGKWTSIVGDVVFRVENQTYFGVYDTPTDYSIADPILPIYGNWLWFDSCDGVWAGVISYDTASISDDCPSGTAGGTPRKHKQTLLINGHEIKTIELPVEFGTGGGLFPMPNYPTTIHDSIGIPYVLKTPEDSSTSGRVVLIRKEYDVDPNPSNWNGVPAPGWNVRFDIYDAAGGKIWTAPPIPGGPIFASSNDRWIYVFTSARSIEYRGGLWGFDSVFTSGRFDDRQYSPLDPVGSRLWIIKHDGSEVIPCGELTDNPHSIPFAFDDSQLYFGGGSTCEGLKLTHDAISIPATFQEIFDHRNDG